MGTLLFSIGLFFLSIPTVNAAGTPYTVAEVTNDGMILGDLDLEVLFNVVFTTDCAAAAGDQILINHDSDGPSNGNSVTTPTGRCTVYSATQVHNKAFVDKHLGDNRIVATDTNAELQFVVEYETCQYIMDYVGENIFVYSPGDSYFDEDLDYLVLPNGEMCSVTASWTIDEWNEEEEPENEFTSATDAILYFIETTKESLIEFQAEVGSADPTVCALLKESYLVETDSLKRTLRAEEQSTEVVWATRMLDEYVTELRRMERECTDIAASKGMLFTDIPSSDSAYEQIMFLREEGIIKGYDDGTFKPENPVNRAELIKILVEGFFDFELKGEHDCFPDVKDEWFAEYICAAKRLGWISGYPDGTYRPGNTVNRAEAMKIIISSGTNEFLSPESLPDDVHANDWFAMYVRIGYQNGFETDRSAFRPGDNLTRREASLWIYNGVMFER